MAQNGRMEVGDNIYGHYRSIFNHYDVIGRQSNRIQWKKTQNNGSGSFKVIDFGINRKPVWDFSLTVGLTDILSRTVSEISQLIVQILDTLRFWGPSPLGLRNKVRCSSWAHWKARSRLPISVNWTFSLGVTVEVLRAKTDRKSAISLQRGHFDPKFQVEGVAPPIICARLVRPMNALQLCHWQFSHKETL